MGEHEGQFTVPVRPPENARSSEGVVAQLLPGTPNEITLNHISPKLPWRAVRILALVSPAWRQAVHSREVYDARVLHDGTETLVVLCHTLAVVLPDEYPPNYVHALSIYSVGDSQSYRLPALPDVVRGIPLGCQMISLDGKVYVVGGQTESFTEPDPCHCSMEVYVLDVAGQWGWKRCADMQEGRMNFGCGVMDGKIYVFGGQTGLIPVLGSEVYDPTADTWSPITPMRKFRSEHEVTALGEELFVHGGVSFDPDYISATDDTRAILIQHALDLDVYHPGKNEWRGLTICGKFAGEFLNNVFLVKGKLHSITPDHHFSLHVDTSEFSLTDVQGCLPDAIWSPLSEHCIHSIDPLVTEVVNGELLELVDYDTDEPVNHTGLLQSKDFARNEAELVWVKATCSLSFRDLETPFICPLQL